MTTKTSGTDTSSANNINALLLQQQQAKKARQHMASSSDEQDGLMFSGLLQDSDKQQNSFITTVQNQSTQNQQLVNIDDDQKKSQQTVDGVSQNQAQSIADIQHAEQAHTTEFCRALQDNHDKHNFEVNLPKIGTFRISTDKAGQKLNFSVSSKEKLPCDWLRTHQSEIETNVGKDLNMEVSLGITQDV